MSEPVWPKIGNEKNVEFLNRVVLSKKPAQTYIFLGPDDLGKSTIALAFARNLMAEALEGKDGLNSDLHILEAEAEKKSISIEQTRELIKALSLSSFLDSYKIGIIKEADSLTTEAQNALLKTLEEPPANSLLILTTPNPALLLPTVVSRCQVIYLQPKENVSSKKIFPNQEIYQKGAAEKIILAQEKGATLESAKSWLREQRKFWQKKASENLPEASLWLEKTLLGEQMLKQNVSPRLVLTYFLLRPKKE